MVAPAVRVVADTKSIGTKVNGIYAPLPEFTITVVTRANANTARSWLAMPNMGQIVPMDPVATNMPQLTVMMKVDKIDPGSQSVFPNLGWMYPNIS